MPPALYFISYILFLIPYSLFFIPYSLFLIPYTLFLIPYSLYLISYSLFLSDGIPIVREALDIGLHKLRTKLHFDKGQRCGGF